MTRKYVIDTSVFLANQVRQGTLEETVKNLLTEMQNSEAEFFMPPSTFAELREILRDSVSDETIRGLESTVVKKSPSRYEVEIPGEMLRKFVDEMRDRMNKGLRLAEKSVRKDESEVEEPDNPHKDRTDVIISDLRSGYKEKTRKDVIDSREDVDLLLLARELDATLVTEDQGILNWTEDLGIKQVKGRNFPQELTE